MKARRSVAALFASAAIAATSVMSAAAGGHEDDGRPRPFGGGAAQVSAWSPYWSSAAAYTSLSAARSSISDIGLFWYEVGCTTSISRAPSNAAQIKALGRPTSATITGETLRPDAFLACTATDAGRDRLASRLVAFGKGSADVDLDLEHLALTTDVPKGQKVRAAYTDLVRRVCLKAHAVSKTCTVTVMPRTSDAYEPWRGVLMPAVYDYAQIGLYADRVRVMAYDEHVSTPGPIASMPWTVQTLAYTLRTVPAQKVQLGVPAYGRVWGGGTVRVLQQRDAAALAASKGATPRVDPVSGETTFAYTSAGVTYTAWYPSLASNVAKASLAYRYGTRGVVMWAAGQDAPGQLAAMARAR